MTAYNPIAAMNRLKNAGLNAKHAEALANELNNARDELVTRTDLKAELNAVALRICAALGAAMALGFTALGVLISLHN